MYCTKRDKWGQPVKNLTYGTYLPSLNRLYIPEGMSFINFWGDVVKHNPFTDEHITLEISRDVQ